ncbi:patatin-like phospholipase domain containing 3 isoform X1 [Triplophysa dalaica]|uniref:patatin-like phospholipase domain containing 3 isoform X1 n=1 Tax=Triplophysa dalaica TaxID=1582913 RepID=UPI0024E0174D|nr:patatin-like phospholipase domain containing 3 isoform X1 [Triplophysa dalaica]
MFDLKEGWNLSFAGCGFLGIYHIGVASCLLEQAPYLVRGATKIYGASAGALTASVLATEGCLEKCCEDVIDVAKEARKRNLGPLHPTFNLMKVLRGGLQRNLPSDAHTLASGRLCVSLTQVTDGQNVLVSDFSSKDELIQALICSCFIPIYCGLIPPAFRGVRYVDGGISDNLPQSELKNTITISPFSGESDICPKDSSTSFHELRFTNTSIQVNLDNMYRLSKALFPPEPKVLAEMCQSGYKDALRFLQENNLLQVACPTADMALIETTSTCCSPGRQNPVVMETTKEWVLRRLRLLRKHHWWLDEQLVDNLPAPIKKVFCEACREKNGLLAQVTGSLPLRVASYMLMPYTLPVQSAYSVAQRFLEWIPEVPADVRWFAEVAGGVYRQAWKGTALETSSSAPLRRCVSEPPMVDFQKPVIYQNGRLPFSASNVDGYSWTFTKVIGQPSSVCPPKSPDTSCPSHMPPSFFVGSRDNDESQTDQ